MKELRGNIGKTATDKITGFTGTITAAACYITGCDQYCLTGKVKDNHTEALSHWYDVNRLEIDEELSPITIETNEVQGAMDSPPEYR